MTLTALTLAIEAHRQLPERVDIGGRQVRSMVIGQGRPTVVLDTFGVAPLEVWAELQREISKFATVFAYDHAGHWGSDPGPKPRDAQHIAEDLRAALEALNLEPPYVLVGYSLGGPYSRVFAGMYPDDVAGLVLVDPTQEEFMDWLREHYPEVNRIRAEDRAAQNEMGSSIISLNQARQSKLPDVPIVLLTGARPHDSFTWSILPRWLKAHQDWLSVYPQGEHVISRESGHNLPFREPELVIQAVREIVDQVRADLRDR